MVGFFQNKNRFVFPKQNEQQITKHYRNIKKKTSEIKHFFSKSLRNSTENKTNNIKKYDENDVINFYFRNTQNFLKHNQN